MKIYFIGQKGIPAIGGGVESYVEELSTRLAAQGHEVYVYTRHHYSSRHRRTYRGVHLINLPTIPTKHLDAISHTLLASLHVIFRPADVIHYHSIGPSSLLWIPKLLKPRTAVVATFQSQCYTHQKWGTFARQYLRIGERILCRYADAVIVPSRALLRHAARYYGRRATLIPNGVAVVNRSVGQNQLKKWGLRRHEYIVAVSRLVRHKGLQHLIAAYKRSRLPLKLVIVGDGTFTPDYVRELHELAAGNRNVVFTGMQHGATLSQLYANAALFVQPSESEGFSIALLEAMSYGLPVVVSDIAANREVVGMAGVTFKNKRSDDLAKKLRLLARDMRLAKALGKQAHARVAEQFDWDVLVHDVVNLYREAVSKKRDVYFSTRVFSAK